MCAPTAPTGAVPRRRRRAPAVRPRRRTSVVTGSASGSPSTETTKDAVPVDAQVGERPARWRCRSRSRGCRRPRSRRCCRAGSGRRRRSTARGRWRCRPGVSAGSGHVGPAAAGRHRGGSARARRRGRSPWSRRRAAAPRPGGRRRPHQLPFPTDPEHCRGDDIFFGVTLRLRQTIRFLVRLTAELAITVGVVLAAFVFYLLVWTGHQTAAAQSDLLDDFHAKADKAHQGRQEARHRRRRQRRRRPRRAAHPRARRGLGVGHRRGRDGRRPGQGARPLPRHRDARRGRQLRRRRTPLDPRRAVRLPRQARRSATPSSWRPSTAG